MRQIKDPVVAAAPAGVRIRTRIRCTAEEAQALTEMGTFLGSTYRGELVERIQLGRLDRTAHAVWRAERKRALTGVSSSRWAGSITRAVEDQYQLGMRGVVAHAADLRTAIDVLAQRCALRPGESAPIVGDAEARSSRSRQRRGYRTPAERFARTRRLATLRGRLVAAENGCATGRPSIAVGGKRLWHNRNNLDATDMSKEQWQERWDAARFFLTADGESGKPGGNETIRVDEEGRLHIKTPAGLASRLGSHVFVEASIRYRHRGDEWADRIAGRRAVRYDVSYDPAADRRYLDASWRTASAPVPRLHELRNRPVVGVDLNAGHMAACVLDRSGNPVGEAVSIEVVTAGLAASHRDGLTRAAITKLHDYAHQHDCAAIVIENLDFAAARAAGRETIAPLLG